LSGKRRFGAIKLSGVLSYGWSQTDSVRSGTLMNDFATAVTHDMDILSSTFQYSYDFEWETWYLRPMIDVGLTQLRVSSASEEGAGAAGFEFADHNEEHIWLRPAIEFGKEFSVTPAYSVRLNLKLGAQKFLSGDSTDVKTWLDGTPMDIDPMSVSMDLGDPRYGGRAGLDIFSKNGFLTQIYYTSNWYDYSDSSTTMLRFQVPFR
jgi:hypothetical protein